MVATHTEAYLRFTTGRDAHGKPTIAWQRITSGIEHSANLDGNYALATNLQGSSLGAIHVLRTNKAQEIVERQNRNAKSTLRVRPIFLHTSGSRFVRATRTSSDAGYGTMLFSLGCREPRSRRHRGAEWGLEE